jgi:hypothetical protein
MSAIRLAVTAVTVAITVARHPAVRAGVRYLAENPRAREVAIETTRRAAYNAGVIARRVIPRALIR